MRACCFKTNIIYIFNDTDLIFFVTIANRLDLFLRAKKKKKKKKEKKKKKNDNPRVSANLFSTHF